jgi:hypothetical protein
LLLKKQRLINISININGRGDTSAILALGEVLRNDQ